MASSAIARSYKALRILRNKGANSTRIAITWRKRPLRLHLQPVRPFQDLVHRRRGSPIGKKVEHIGQRHFVDLRRRISARGHEPPVDKTKIDAGGRSALRAPAQASPRSDFPSVAESCTDVSMKPPRRRTAAIAAAISGAVASISPSDFAASA